MEKRRFSLYVRDSISKGDFGIVDDLFDGIVITSEDRARRSELTLSKARNNFEWSLELISWAFGLFPKVVLTRGEHIVKLNRREHKGLAYLYKAIVQEQKEQETSKANLLDYYDAFIDAKALPIPQHNKLLNPF